MITVRDAIVRVRRELGDDYTAIQVDEYWVIGTMARGAGFARVSPEPLRTSLARAIEDVKETRST